MRLRIALLIARMHLLRKAITSQSNTGRSPRYDPLFTMRSPLHDRLPPGSRPWTVARRPMAPCPPVAIAPPTVHVSSLTLSRTIRAFPARPLITFLCLSARDTIIDTSISRSARPTSTNMLTK